MSSHSQQIRTLVVDDHPLLRAGVAALIGTQEDMVIVGEATSGREAIESYRALRPDVTLMDIQMADMSGIDAIIAIRNEFSNAKVVVLTTYEGDALAYRALKAGARAYLLKSLVRKDLLNTVREVNAGHKHIQSEVAARLADHAADDRLTEREVQVLSFVAKGMANKDIAFRLGTASGTIKMHVQNILEKLGASDRTHAVTLAIERGILHLDF